MFMLLKLFLVLSVHANPQLGALMSAAHEADVAYFVSVRPAEHMLEVLTGDLGANYLYPVFTDQLPALYEDQDSIAFVFKMSVLDGLPLFEVSEGEVFLPLDQVVPDRDFLLQGKHLSRPLLALDINKEPGLAMKKAIQAMWVPAAIRERIINRLRVENVLPPRGRTWQQIIVSRLTRPCELRLVQGGLIGK
jgi:hypothetical protein